MLFKVFQKFQFPPIWQGTCKLRNVKKNGKETKKKTKKKSEKSNAKKRQQNS